VEAGTQRGGDKNQLSPHLVDNNSVSNLLPPTGLEVLRDEKSGIEVPYGSSEPVNKASLLPSEVVLVEPKVCSSNV